MKRKIFKEEEKKQNIFQKISKIFSPKMTEDEKQIKWNKRLSKRKKSTASTSEPVEKEGRKVFRIPHLRKIKRIIAGILVLVNGVFFFIGLYSSPPLWIIFAGNTFILIDYLWKTGNWRITKDEDDL